jgi:putative glutathione S-transferase
MATTTTTTVASPVDFETYGDYAPPAGAYRRQGNLTSLIYPIDGRISDDGSTEFAAEAGRYHLYFSLYCPWAQRPLIALKLRGLDDVVSWSAVDPVRDGRGWAFRDGNGHGPDPVNGFTLLRDAYLATDPTFDGHVSVPALWDRVSGRLVSNHYATMTVDLETCFTEWADPSVELYPEGHRAAIEAMNDEIVRDLGGGTYAALGARTQAEYDAVSTRVFEALDRFEDRLATRRFLVAHHITDSDLLLYVNLVRFDVIAGPLGRLNLRRLVDYPNLWGYARDLYQRPAFRETTSLDHIKRGTFMTGAGARTSRVVPAGPIADWDAPHDRDQLG